MTPKIGVYEFLKNDKLRLLECLINVPKRIYIHKYIWFRLNAYFKPSKPFNQLSQENSCSKSKHQLWDMFDFLKILSSVFFFLFWLQKFIFLEMKCPWPFEHSFSIELNEVCYYKYFRALKSSAGC
jgi:hypothetical protein